MFCVCRAALSLAIALVLAVPASAQSTAGTLRGVVRDEKGAPVPGATVEVVTPGTALMRRATTDASGSFVVVDVPPAVVDVTISASGFGDVRRTGIPVEVGQTASLVVALPVGRVREAVVVAAAVGVVAVDTNRSVVDAVIPSQLIESLPLNGRNFLELALLVPGNAPAPNFDPTKSNTVTISSAGQLGRGGNIMVDGADNNDDVVGGPLLNVTQEAVQEFQIATNRFTAETGRSASSAINVVTKSGSDQLRGSTSLFLRDSPLAGAAGHLRPQRLAKSRPSIASSLPEPPEGRSSAVRRSGLGPRSTATRTVGCWLASGTSPPGRSAAAFAPAPLEDVLGSARVDWRVGGADTIAFRYAGERADDTAASTLDRAIGSASQRQSSRNRYQSVVAHLDAHVVTDARQRDICSFSTFRNQIDPVAVGPQLTFPSLQDGSSFRVPQGTEQKRFQLADTVTLVTGAHMLRVGGEWQRVDADFDLDVFRQGRIEFVEDFAGFDHNGDGRVDDGDLLFAVTLRSGKPDQALVIPDADNHYLAGFVQDDWRVRPDLTLNAACATRSTPTSRTSPRWTRSTRSSQPFLKGTRERDLNNLGPRIGFNWAPGDGAHKRSRRLRHLLRPRHAGDSVARARARRTRAADRGAGRQRVLPESGDRTVSALCAVDAQPVHRLHPPGAGASGINIIDNTHAEPERAAVQSRRAARAAGRVVLRVDGVHNFGTHFIIGRTIGEVFNPVVGGPDRIVNLESSVNTQYDALLVSAEQRAHTTTVFVRRTRSSKAFNYANDDQIPFSNGPIDPTEPRGSSTVRRQTISDIGSRWRAGHGSPAVFVVAPIWTIASGVPMDILMPDAQSRVPVFQRNAGGRLFKTPAALNRGTSPRVNAQWWHRRRAAAARERRRHASMTASIRLDVRVSRPFRLRQRAASSRSSRCSTCSTSRTSWASRIATTRATRTCSCATAATRRIPGYLTSSQLRQAGHHRGRRVRDWRAARVPVRGPGDILMPLRGGTLARELTLSVGDGARGRPGDRRRHLPDTGDDHPHACVAALGARRLGCSSAAWRSAGRSATARSQPAIQMRAAGTCISARRSGRRWRSCTDGSASWSWTRESRRRSRGDSPATLGSSCRLDRWRCGWWRSRRSSPWRLCTSIGDPARHAAAGERWPC